MDNYIVVMMEIGEDFIPCAWMLRVVHVQEVYDHPIDKIYLAISLGWKVVYLVSLVSIIDERLD